MRRGIQGHDDYGAKLLRDNAFGLLERIFGFVKIFSDDAGTAVESDPQGGLAWGKIARSDWRSFFRAGETAAELAGGISFEEKTSVGLRDRDGVVDHRGEDGV